MFSVSFERHPTAGMSLRGPKVPRRHFVVIVLDVSEISFQFFKLLSTPFYCLLVHVSGHRLGDFLNAESLN